MSEGKPVILYVDDDPDYCEALRVILEANGYEMAEAASAEEGLEVYKAGHYGLDAWLREYQK